MVSEGVSVEQGRQEKVMKVRLGVSAIVSLVLAAALPALAQEPYEGPAVLTPAEVLRADLVRGPHYTLADKVETKGYLHEFVVQSDYGSFTAAGTSMLYGRLREVQALAALDDVSKSEVFLAAAGASVLSVGKSVGKAVADPKGTVKGVGAGLKSYGENLGRKAKRTAETAADAVKGDEKTESGDPGGASTAEKAVDAGASVAKSYFGVTGASRRWAQKLGVDPYTSNPVLRKALEEIGTIDAAGGIAAKTVVPIPAVISTGAEVSNLVWGKDPEELLKLNEQRLADLGVDKAVAASFFKSKAFSPSQQTRFVAALHAVRAAGLPDYVDAAREAGGEVEAEFFTESAEMLAALHARNRVEAVLTDSRAMVARVGDKRAVALLPLDSIRWTEGSRKALTEIAERARKELGASRLEIELTGRMSPRALEESQAIGWNVSQGVPGPVAPPKPAGTP
jgi:hypothetical protein